MNIIIELKYNFIFNENIIFNYVGFFIFVKLYFKVIFLNINFRSNLIDFLNRNDIRYVIMVVYCSLFVVCF